MVTDIDKVFSNSLINPYNIKNLFFIDFFQSALWSTKKMVIIKLFCWLSQVRTWNAKFSFFYFKDYFKKYKKKNFLEMKKFQNMKDFININFSFLNFLLSVPGYSTKQKIWNFFSSWIRLRNIYIKK